jgi:CubicO group peptidase (beta-lactamase class C family)
MLTFKACVTLISLLLTISFQVQSLFAQPEKELLDEIGKIAKYELGMQEHELPSMLIGIVDGNESYVLEFGREARTDRFPITIGSVMETGSVTKVFTAALCCHLAGHGLIDLNATVGSFLTDHISHSPLSDMTIMDLLLHRTGLPKYPANIGQYESDEEGLFANYPEDAMWQAISAFLKDPQPENPKYSHVNYAVIEYLLEKALGQSFEEMFINYFRDTLGIEKVALLQTQRLPLVQGYDLGGEPVTHNHFQSFAASEGMAITMQGLLKFMHIALDTANGLYPGECFRMRSRSEFNQNIEYAGGWFVAVDKNSYPIFVQQGKGLGHSAFIGILRETKTGVCILSNSAAATPELGMMTLRMINRNWKRKE